MQLGKIEGRGRRGRQKMRWLDGITDSMDGSLSELWRWCRTGRPGELPSMGRRESGTTERLNRSSGGAVVNTGAGVLWDYSLPGHLPRSRIAGLYGSPALHFLRKLSTAFRSGRPQSAFAKWMPEFFTPFPSLRCHSLCFVIPQILFLN